MGLVRGVGGHLVRRVAPGRLGTVPCSRTGVLPDICFLVATSTHGILLYRQGRLTRVLPGNCYGMTSCDGWWYAFQRLGDYGRVVRFRLAGDRAEGTRTVLTGLNYGIHQMDFIDGRLVLVDTLKDRLLAYDGAAGRRGDSWRRWSCQVYPAGRRATRDFRWDRLAGESHTDACWHFNSVFSAGGMTYLVAHNRSVLTGRRSELFVLDAQFVLREIRDLGAADVHNFWTDGVREMYCASARGGLRRGPGDLVALGGYLRGLSVGTDFVLVGSSRLAADRRVREEGDGQIHALDAALAPVGQLTITGTQIHEIRRVDAADLALSPAQAGSAGRATGA